MHTDQGFTLIEAIVATAVTVTILALSLQAFTGALQATEAVELMAGTNQNLQVAGTWLTDDLVKAGQDLPAGGTTVPSGLGSEALVRPGPAGLTFPPAPVFYAIAPGNDDGPLISPPANPDDPADPPPVIRTDVITVVYVDRTLPTLPLTHLDGTTPVTDIADDGASMVVHYDPLAADANRGVQINSNAVNTLARGDLMLFSNMNGAVIQEVTSDPDAGNPQRVVFDPATDVTKFNQPGAANGGITMLKGGAAGFPPTTARRLSMVTYFIDRTDPEQPMLMRQVNARAAIPIALGVENLQFAFSLYTGTAKFLDVMEPVDPRTPNDIRKVSVYLGARSERRARSGGAYARNSLLTQVNVRNLGFFDIYK